MGENLTIDGVRPKRRPPEGERITDPDDEGIDFSSPCEVRAGDWILCGVPGERHAWRRVSAVRREGSPAPDPVHGFDTNDAVYFFDVATEGPEPYTIRYPGVVAVHIVRPS